MDRHTTTQPHLPPTSHHNTTSLSHRTIAPPHRRTTTSPHRRTTAPPQHLTTVRLHYHATAPPHHRSSGACSARCLWRAYWIRSDSISSRGKRRTASCPGKQPRRLFVSERDAPPAPHLGNPSRRLFVSWRDGNSDRCRCASAHDSFGGWRAPSREAVHHLRGARAGGSVWLWSCACVLALPRSFAERGRGQVVREERVVWAGADGTWMHCHSNAVPLYRRGALQCRMTSSNCRTAALLP